MTTGAEKEGPASRVFVGTRLKQLRKERELSQATLAHTLGLSASYVNQIENDSRPLTSSVLRKITHVFGIDEAFFSREDDSRLVAEVHDVTLDREVCPTSIDVQEVADLVHTHPELARALVDIHRRYRNVSDKLSLVTEERNRSDVEDSSTGSDALTMPHEEVRDFFYARQNYIDSLDVGAEELAGTLGLGVPNINHVEDCVATRLTSKYGVEVRYISHLDATGNGHPDTAEHMVQHRFSPDTGVLTIDAHLTSGQKAFRMATELAYLEVGDQLHSLVDEDPRFTSDESRQLAVRGAATYYAAALVLPYTNFHAQAERAGYDIEYLSTAYGMGYETICHRLSTLQRPKLRGIPWTFVRVDRAGNVSKRQPATGFHFTHSGGTCPLWNVYETFSYPGKVMRQLAQMPDGRTYMWVARTVKHYRRRFGQPGKVFAIGLGCEARHAERTVYAEGLDLSDLAAATPIGPGCRVCSRTECPQRAFPSILHDIRINTHSSSVNPY